MHTRTHPHTSTHTVHTFYHEITLHPQLRVEALQFGIAKIVSLSLGQDLMPTTVIAMGNPMPIKHNHESL